jgi:hypothetical protein
VRLDDGREGWVASAFLEFAPVTQTAVAPQGTAEMPQDLSGQNPNWQRLYLLLGAAVVLGLITTGTVAYQTTARRGAGTSPVPAAVVAQETTAVDPGGSLAQLRRALDAKDDEIRRYRNGHDAHLFRRFLHRFIRVDQALRQFSQDGGAHSQERQQIQRLLADALEECGVEKFEPRVGEDYRATPGLSDNPKIVAPPDAASAFRIVEVIEPGYRLRHSEGYDVITPAKVKVYGAMGG